MGTTYPDLLVLLDGEESLRAVKVKGHHGRSVPILADIGQEPEPSRSV